MNKRPFECAVAPNNQERSVSAAPESIDLTDREGHSALRLVLAWTFLWVELDPIMQHQEEWGGLEDKYQYCHQESTGGISESAPLFGGQMRHAKFSNAFISSNC